MHTVILIGYNRLPDVILALMMSSDVTLVLIAHDVILVMMSDDVILVATSHDDILVWSYWS